MASKTSNITIIELVIGLVIASIVLLPIGVMTGALLNDWHKGRELKLLQEELDLAAYSIKGVMEEAYGYDDIADGEQNSSIKLYMGANREKELVIRSDGRNLMLDGQAVVGSLAEGGLKFNPDNGLVRVEIRLEGEKTGAAPEKSFNVRLRNL